MTRSECIQLFLVAPTDALGRELAPLLGGTECRLTHLRPEEVSRADWRQLRGTGPVWAVVSPPDDASATREMMASIIQTLSVGLHPQRLVAILDSMSLDHILSVVRAGADGILQRGATPRELHRELRRAGTQGKDYFPDPQNWLGSLRRASEELLLIDDPKTQLPKLLTIFVSQLRVDRCSIMLVDEEGNLRVEAGLGLPDGLGIGSVITPNPGSVSSWVLQHRRARLVQGTLDATGSSRGRRALSAISAPLITRQHLLGVVNFSSFDPERQLSSTDLAAAQVFASMLAMAIHGHRLLLDNLEQERLSAIGRTMAHVSHSIKNILLIFNGANMILKNGFEKGELAQAREGYLMSERAARRLEGLIMELLDYSKERQPTLRRTYARELLESVRATYFDAIKREKHTLLIACNIDEPVWVDARRLQLALFNLLSNAIDVMTAGGVIRMEAEALRETIIFRVCDEGPGAPEETLGRIFEPFYSTKGSKGTGLGLAMVQKFAEECGGRVWAENLPESGLAISIELPLILKGDTLAKEDEE